jgi:hypothetical protein
VNDKTTLEVRLADLEGRMTAQALALYTVIWTISRIDRDAADRIMDSLDRVTGHLKPDGHASNAVLAEMAKLQLALRRAFEAQDQRPG